VPVSGSVPPICVGITSLVGTGGFRGGRSGEWAALKLVMDTDGDGVGAWIINIRAQNSVKGRGGDVGTAEE